MSRNVWHYGLPLLDQSGSAHWSNSWSPALSSLLAPLGALPMAAGVVTERLVVMVTGLAFLALAYVWMREDLGLSRLYAAIATTCVAATSALVIVSSRVLSDAPAAAAVMGAIVLLRRGRWSAGLALLALAALIRPINVAAFIAATGWLLLTHWGRRALLMGVGVAAVATTALISIAILLGAYRGYFSQVATPGAGGVTRTFVDQAAKELTW